MPNPQLVAVDTNVLLLLAEHDDLTRDALDTIHSRLRSVDVIASPTVLGELAYKARRDPSPDMRELALKAIRLLHTGTEVGPAHLTGMEETLVEKAAATLRQSGLVPSPERNDAWIIAESAVLNCVLLVSNDSHLLDIDHRRLGLLFREMDLPVPIIVSPLEIVRKFFR
jgi:hypothetical protein